MRSSLRLLLLQSLSGSGGAGPSRTDPFVSEDDLYNCLGRLPSSCWLACSPKLQFLRFCLCLGNTHRFHFALWTPLDPALRQNWTSKQEGGRILPKAYISNPYKIGILGIILGSVALQLNITALVIMQDLGGTLEQVGINASVAAAVEVPCMVAT